MHGLGVNFHAVKRGQEIQFQYNHSVDKAVLYPDFRSIQLIEDLGIHGDLDAVLMYGMIELNSLPNFSGNRVVYDPQSGAYSTRFRSENRVAKELALVCNLSEARCLASIFRGKNSDTLSPRELGRTILAAERAEVVVVKNGPFGATVVSPGGCDNISSYKTSRVFGIGTGDIFSAVFAALWAGQDYDPIHAAKHASIATA